MCQAVLRCGRIQVSQSSSAARTGPLSSISRLRSVPWKRLTERSSSGMRPANGAVPGSRGDSSSGVAAASANSDLWDLRAALCSSSR